MSNEYPAFYREQHVLTVYRYDMTQNKNSGLSNYFHLQPTIYGVLFKSKLNLNIMKFFKKNECYSESKKHKNTLLWHFSCWMYRCKSKLTILLIGFIGLALHLYNSLLHVQKVLYKSIRRFCHINLITSPNYQ